MGDSDNAVPPSKKRVAGRQITQLDPEPDDDAPEPEMGTFKKASEDVLAARRIVKVRRHQSSSAPSSAPAPNPFAGIRLVPTTDSGAKATISTAEPQNVVENKASEEQEVTNEKPEKASEEKESNTDALVSEPSERVENTKLEDETDKSEVNDKLKSDGAEDVNRSILTGEDVEKEAGEKEKAVGDETEKAGGEETDKGKQSDDPKVTAEQLTPVSSFQQLSSSQNAFTGLSGTGFSTSSFSFGGSFGKEGGSTFSSGSFFGSNNGSPSFPSFGSGGSNNGSSSFPLFDTTKNGGGGASSIPAMQDVPIETGEENEKAVFSSDAVLYEYLDGGWKERGKGELKVNISVSGAEKARLVMRSRGNYRLILNASLYPDMALTNMDKKGVTFACVNSAGEGKSGLTTFALKFRDSTFAEEFRGVVTAHKGKAAAATILKTPENSPQGI